MKKIIPQSNLITVNTIYIYEAIHGHKCINLFLPIF